MCPRAAPVTVPAHHDPARQGVDRHKEVIAMKNDSKESGTTLVEPQAEMQITLPEVGSQPARRTHGWLVAAITIAVVLAATWALLLRPTDEATAPPGDVPTETAPTVGSGTVTHDSGITAQLRERFATQSEHDSGIAAQLKRRGDVPCVAPGAGGWEPRLSSC
jgi:hypothetical protein